MGRWIVVSVLCLVGCAKELCADVVCRREPIAVCANDDALTSGAALGSCEPSTGACVFPPERTNACGPGTRCSDGACRCDPTRCTGCCAGSGHCVAAALRSPAACGSGMTCFACPPNHVCDGSSCRACGALEAVTQNACASDDTAWFVEIDGGFASPGLVLDERGATVWHAGLINEFPATIVTRDPAARINGGGSRLELMLPANRGLLRTRVAVQAPSGRILESVLVSSAGELMSDSQSRNAGDGGREIDVCVIGTDGHLLCTLSDVPDAGPFVTLHAWCGLSLSGEVWCRDFQGVWTRHFADVEGIVDGFDQAVLTRDGRIFVPETPSREHDAGAVALECWARWCMYLDEQHRVRQLRGTFDDWSGRWNRLQWLGSRFVAQAEDGGVWFRRDEVGLQGEVISPIAGSSSSTLELTAPAHGVLGLENDGGVWLGWVDPAVRRESDAGGPFIDVGGDFMGLTPDRRAVPIPFN